MATTAAQSAASRANAARSTDPVTAAGKAKVSQNAISHGLTSTRLILPGETEADFEALWQATATRFDVQTPEEHHLAYALAASEWRLARAWRVHDSFLNMCIQTDDFTVVEGRTTSPDILANSLNKPETVRRMSLILRYIRAAERSGKAAEASLHRLLAARLANEEASEITNYEAVRDSCNAESDAYIAESNLHHDEFQQMRREHRAQQSQQKAEPPAQPQQEPQTATTTPRLPRAERRALERAARKAAKKDARLLQHQQAA